MNPEHLPESAKRAFDSYPHLEPSASFNREVLASLSSAQNKRRRTFIGRIEEFLGLGLWQFAGSGALGALLPGAILGAMMLSGGGPRAVEKPVPPPYLFGGWVPFEALRREHLLA